MPIVFENQGEIDIRSIKILGVSVKEGENPIGFFGTGLKYSLAILLRNNQEVTIASGLNLYKFGVNKTEIRGKEFSVVTMNGEELGFTTDLGKQWEMWQAFREIYCNCLDEKGSVYEQEEMVPQAGMTKILVDGYDFEHQYKHRDEIVLNKKNMVNLIPGVRDYELYEQETDFVYYRGIRVFNSQKKMKILFNMVVATSLTEDRTMAYPFTIVGRMGEAFAKLKQKSIIRSILNARDELLESEATFSNLQESMCSPEFLSVLAEEYHRNSDSLNPSAKALHMKLVNSRHVKNREPADLTDVEKKQLARATSFLKKAYDDFEDYPVIVVKTLGEKTVGMADREERSILVSKRCFSLGTKYLASTLYEEYCHLKTGYGDMTRELQTYLFDEIMTMVENKVGEPI